MAYQTFDLRFAERKENLGCGGLQPSELVSPALPVRID